MTPTTGAAASFAADLDVEPTTNGWRAFVCEDWSIWGPNGGYLSAIALVAAGRMTALDTPAGVTTTFLRPAAAGELDLEVQVLKQSRGSVCARVTAHQDQPVF